MTEEEYNELVKNYYNIVYKKALTNVRMCEETAKDITQETFLKAYRSRHQWNRQSSASSWLYRICVNEIGMWYRKNKKHITGEYLDRRDFYDIDEEEYNNHSYEIQDPIDKKQFDKNLEPIEIQIIKMKYQGYKTKEVALIMGKTKAAIKSRIHRIRLKILSPKKTRHIRDVPKLPAAPKRIRYKPTQPAKVYKFTPHITPKKMPRPRKNKGTVGTGDIKPRTWKEYFKKKAVNG